MILTDCENFNLVSVLLLMAREYGIIHELWTYWQEMISYVFAIKKISFKIVFHFERLRTCDRLKLKNRRKRWLQVFGIK
jgi:hypothetical protein